ncbi:MAG: hypothetical protein IKQ69_02660 [Oscillospiraceae bacterium]|nr:hypothetical protein [Oscillospiraceae bacterium]MBR6207877.1 hypothetical protein [Oscillospiraceae bacterium]
MRRLILLLLATQMLTAALGEIPETDFPEPVPPVTQPAEEEVELRQVLERIAAEYDPAAAGTVGAIRWAEKLLSAWVDGGQDPETARRAAEGMDPAVLEPRLSRLRWAAEKLCSGADLGLMNEPGHRRDWTGTEIESLFTALSEAAGLM